MSYVKFDAKTRTFMAPDVDTPRLREAEQLIATYESQVIDWLRQARSASPTSAALGCREMAADALMLALKYTRRLCMMEDQQRRQAEAGRPRDPDEVSPS